MLRITLVGLVFSATFLAGQTSSKILDFNQHGWVSYSGDHPVASKWGVHFDAQWRRSEVFSTWQQYQLRPGLNYQLSDAVLLTGGYAFTRSYPYGDFPMRIAMPEHRVYQQVLVSHRMRGVRLQHRTRMEQRWIQYPDTSPEWTYQNRFRYLAKLEAPLKPLEAGEIYLSAYDEILIGIPPNYGARPFDQNRVFAGLGYQMGDWKMEAGYLNQFLGQRNGRVFEMNHTLFFTVTSTLPLGELFR